MTVVAPITPEILAEAVNALRAGNLVAFPTETVYGLGADACSDEAVAKIYAAKERPSFNPLIAHVHSLEAAIRHGMFDRHARALAEAFWPGPLTLVVPARPDCGVSLLARAGLDSVALRVPSHPVARDLLGLAGMPVAAPSANRSGRISPTQAEHVLAELEGRLDLIIDGGPCAVGLESTVVSCLGRLRILRPGGITREAIEAVAGLSLSDIAEGDAAPIGPGMLASHYAPDAAVRLNATVALDGEAVLDFGGQLRSWHDRTAYADLSAAGDLAEAAANLFGALRRLDRVALRGIAVAPVPRGGLGQAINDRLQRAAAPRPAQP